ncbi:MAG TPA: potassium/proton antiporter [Conexibacter sp.]|jgi:cell volume regulation protein A|nr:potassium/proton antiporter [Conexibacter sp.]
MADGHLVLVAGALLTAALAASLLAGRLRLPSLVLFLGVGMAVGTDGLGWVDFGNYRLARDIGIVALALILFEGGLNAGFGEIRPVLKPVVSLAFLGTLITAAICGLAATWLFDFTLLEGLLVGAIVCSTDGAAIFAMLRGSSLKRRLTRTLEGEAGMNDPVAVLLVIGFIDWIQQPGYGLGDMLWLFVREVGIGTAIGVAVGVAAVAAFKRVQLPTPGLYPVASIATAALAFGAADTLHGSGFLAVYLAGLVLGSATIPARHTITTFHQGMAWIAQLGMFLVLGLLVFPSQLPGVAVQGTVLALVLVLVARPVAAFVASWGPFSAADRAVLGWAGLRGAVPVVLATFPVIAGVPHSGQFFDIVFFAVLVSTVLQGATFEPFARRLGVTASGATLTTSGLTETGTIRQLGADAIEVDAAPGDALVGHRIRDLGLPRAAVVNVIVRDGQAIPPRGSTRIEAGDSLHVLIRREAMRTMGELLERWREGPVGPPPRKPRIPEGHAPIFHVRRWDAADGDPARAEHVAGRAVVDRLRTRRDVPGALVLLDDGYFAVTGPVLALGRERLLSEWVRRKARAAGGDAERAWWEEVLGALAL